MAPSLVELESPIRGDYSGKNALVFTKTAGSSEDASELDLGQFWCSHESLVQQSFKKSTFLKAAWILTLRCFQPEELISIQYDEGSALKSGSTPMVYTVRVNPEWNVQSLLDALEATEAFAVSSSLQPHGAQISQLPPSRHVYTSALRYLVAPEQYPVPSSSDHGGLEVS